LRTTGANTYTGVTDINAGTLVVTSLGSSTGAETSSVGAAGAGVTMDDANAVTIGNAGTGNAILQYVGPGETSDRKIRINATTGTGAGAQIHADGTGPLILTNVANDMVSNAAVKNLWLRGSSPYVNQVQSVLANNGGPLNVNIDGGTAWVLTNAGNSYTGTTTVGGGALGIGHDTAIPGALTHSGGNIFAHGGDRTLGVAVTYTLANNATGGFFGDYNLVFAGTSALGAAANNVTLVNSVVAGKSVTFNGLTANALTAARAWTVNGPGETVINGNFTTTTNFWVRIDKTGDGTLVLGTSGAGSDWNTKGSSVSAVDLDRGTLRFSANEAIPSVGGAGGLLISPELAEFDTATVDLNGTTQTITSLTATSNGTSVIDNTSASVATLTVGAGDSAVNFGFGGAGAYSITQTGGGTISLVKIGTGTANLAGTLSNTGSTTVSGGTFNYNSATGTSAVSVDSGAQLNLKGGLITPASMTGVTLAGGGNLSFASGLGQAMANLTSLSLGAGTGTAVLELDAGDTGTDTLTLSSGVATAQNTITLLIKDIDLSNLSQYTLISAPGGGLSGATYSLSLAGYTGSSLTESDTAIILNTGTLVTSDVYWNAGASTTAWNTVVAGTPDLTNFSSDAAGTLTAATLPGKGQKVIFIADSIAGGAALSTTLEQPFKINALQFRASSTPANTPSSITIAPGAVLSNSLTLAPSASADGISLATGASATVTISAPVVAQSAQTWTVTDSAQALNISGALTGAGNITKAGAGTLTLSAAGSGYTGAFAVNAGTVVLTNATALSGIVAGPGAGAAVTLGTGGAFYYNNGTSSTVSNNLTFAGGTLSAGGNAQTYSGAVTVTSATTTTINLRDLNSATTSTTARNITLSGAMSGTGGISLDSIDTLTGGNAETGTLTINNGAGTWTGPLSFTRGTVVFTNVAGGGTVTPYVGYDGPITFSSLGRVIYRNLDGAGLTRSAGLSFAAGSIGEFSVDNLSATLASNYTITQQGAVSLGSAGTGATARFNLADAASNLIITGGVVLSGNSSISVEGGDADSLVTISGTGISGTGDLAINDEAGVWAVTSTRLAINAASTFIGNTTLRQQPEHQRGAHFLRHEQPAAERFRGSRRHCPHDHRQRRRRGHVDPLRRDQQSGDGGRRGADSGGQCDGYGRDFRGHQHDRRCRGRHDQQRRLDLFRRHQPSRRRPDSFRGRHARHHRRKAQCPRRLRRDRRGYGAQPQRHRSPLLQYGDAQRRCLPSDS